MNNRVTVYSGIGTQNHVVVTTEGVTAQGHNDVFVLTDEFFPDFLTTVIGVGIVDDESVVGLRFTANVTAIPVNVAVGHNNYVAFGMLGYHLVGPFQSAVTGKEFQTHHHVGGAADIKAVIHVI